jgi:trigger factor
MAAELKTTVTELPESRVRVEAEVPAEEVERRVQQAAKALGRELRIPGFRKGKVPPPVVVRRLGRDAVLDEAVRGSLSRWYVDAIDAADVVPVGDPTLDIGDLPAEGEPLTFTVEIGVRPTAVLGEYKGLEVGRREAQVADDAIDGEIEGLRERLARLETAEGPAAMGDFLVLDYVGTRDGEPVEGAEGRDQLAELGAGRLLPGMDEQLVGITAGETHEIDVTMPDDHPEEEVRGAELRFTVTAKEVKRRDLPELDDDFATEAAGLDSIDELRAEIRGRLEEAESRQIEAEFREAAVDAAAARATIEVPEALVQARAAELWDQLAHSLSHQGISKEAYLQISGRTEAEMLAEARPDAEEGLRREATLAAVVAAEGVEVTEADVLEALAPAAEREGAEAAELLGRLRERGREDALRSDLATRKAIDVIAEAATPIPAEQAEAREKLWTPEKDEPESAAGGKLWTPGD